MANAASIEKAYELAKQRYADVGVNTDQALAAVKKIPISLHCWQGDDVGGFESSAGLTGGGIQGLRLAGANGTTRLGMNLEDAYPAGSGIDYVRREFTFSRQSPAITVADTVRVAEGPLAVQVPLFTPCEVAEREPGLLAIGTRPRALLIRFDPRVLTASIEEVPLEDPQLQASWGPLLRRITLALHTPEASAAYRIEFGAEG